MMTALLGLAASLAVVIAAAVAVGLRLDSEYQVRVEATIEAAIDRVYARLAEVDRYALWRSDVSRVEWLGERTPATWVEHLPTGRVHLELVDDAPPHRREHRLVHRLGSHRGAWTFELAEISDTETTRITIIETKHLPNPVLRAFHRYCLVPDAPVRTWLGDLEHSFLS